MGAVFSFLMFQSYLSTMREELAVLHAPLTRDSKELFYVSFVFSIYSKH